MQRLHAAAAAAPTSIIREIQCDLASGARSAVSIAEQYLARLHEREPVVQSFITVAADTALGCAADLDRNIASRGEAAMGPLAGVPVGIKVSCFTIG